MFAVVHIQATPDHLRGYLSRFLQEVRTGVYVGVVTPRVTDALWMRVTEAAGSGAATLIISDHESETGYRVRLHNVTTHRVAPLDGIDLPVERATRQSMREARSLTTDFLGTA